jgi:hypothetical protein
LVNKGIIATKQMLVFPCQHQAPFPHQGEGGVFLHPTYLWYNRVGWTMVRKRNWNLEPAATRTAFWVIIIGFIFWAGFEMGTIFEGVKLQRRHRAELRQKLGEIQQKARESYFKKETITDSEGREIGEIRYTKDYEALPKYYEKAKEMVLETPGLKEPVRISLEDNKLTMEEYEEIEKEYLELKHKRLIEELKDLAKEGQK